MGRIVLTIALAAGLAGFVGWYFGLFAGEPTGPDGSGHHEQVASPESLGDALFPPAKEDQKAPHHKVAGGRDQIVFSGMLNVMDKVDVPSPIPGQILYIGEGVPEGVTQVAGIAPFMQGNYEQATVAQAGHDIVKFYRPLKIGHEVQNGQIVGEIDFSRAIYSFLQHKALWERAQTEYVLSGKMDEFANSLLNMTLKQGGSGSEKERLEAILTRVRTSLDVLKSAKEVEKERHEMDAAATTLAQHELRFKLPVTRGFIQEIYHGTTEAVKENEPVLQIYSTDRVMAEAFVEPQYARLIHRNMMVTVEPVQDEMPLRMFEGHRAKAPITSVAFAFIGNALHVVSASEDGFLKMWRQDIKGAVASVPHREPIKAMACSPVSAKKPLCVTGSSDGKIHLWNLDPDNNPIPRPVAVLEKPLDAHRDAVTALAFSPDGMYFASGAADGSMKLWRSEDGQLVYAFTAAHGVDSPHKGGVTSLAFTPHSRLVSAGRDHTMRIWTLREKGAYLKSLPIANRSGNVNQLGVSQDGRWMLFDQGKSLQLMTVPEGEVVNTLKDSAGAITFETLALFSPDASLILTGGAPEGRLQLWRAPSENSRGFEVRQFVTKQRSPVTCAAFAPTQGPAGAASFAASGTRDGNVYLWPVPSREDIGRHRIHNVPVKQISRTAEAGGRFKIGVEVANPDGRLSPGRAVTIVVE